MDVTRGAGMDDGLSDERRILGELMLAVRETSRLRSGLGLSSLSDEEDVALTEIVGGEREPRASDERALDKNPAWNLLGFETGRLDTSGMVSEGLDSSAELSLLKFKGMAVILGIAFSGELRSGEESNF